jgi:2-phospho-L-lactate guanylyltransferase
VIPDAFLVPLKAFDRAKERLRADPALDVPALAASLAAGVIAACAPVDVVVVTESPAVADFARDRGAQVWCSDARDLNEALQGAYEGLSTRWARLCVVHGDLLRPQGLGDFDPADGVTLITDHHGTGTNVLALPGGTDFHFAYGPDSARSHESEARRLGLEVHVITSGPWCLDVDRPEDLELRPDGV